MRYLHIILIFLLSACSDMAIIKSEKSKEVNVDGINFLVYETSFLQYKVIHKDYFSNNIALHPDDFSSRKFQFEKAIEKSTGCKIKSSLLAEAKSSLTALVQC